MSTALASVLIAAAVLGVVLVVDLVLIGGPGSTKPAMWRRRLAFVIEAVAIAGAFYSISTALFTGPAGGDVLVATFVNIGVIVAVVTWDQLVHVLRARLVRWEAGARSRLLAGAVWWTTGASWKAGLYVFYIALLVVQAVLAASPGIDVDPLFAGYLASVRYGLLILVAADKFTEQMVKELRREDEVPAQRRPAERPR